MIEQKIELFIGPPSITTDIEIKIPNADCNFYINCYNAQKIKNYLDKYVIFLEKISIYELISMPNIENTQTHMDIIDKHLDNYKDELLDLIIHFGDLMPELKTFLENLIIQNMTKENYQILKYCSLNDSYEDEIHYRLKYFLNFLHIKLLLKKFNSTPEDQRKEYASEYQEILIHDIQTYKTSYIKIANYNIQIMKIEKVTQEIYNKIKQTLPKIHQDIEKMSENDKDNAYLIYTDDITDIDPNFKFFNISDEEIEFSKLCIIADLKERYRNKDNSKKIEKGFRIIPEIRYNSECMKENINESSINESSKKESSKKESIKESSKKESLNNSLNNSIKESIF